MGRWKSIKRKYKRVGMVVVEEDGVGVFGKDHEINMYVGGCGPRGWGWPAAPLPSSDWPTATTVATPTPTHAVLTLQRETTLMFTLLFPLVPNSPSCFSENHHSPSLTRSSSLLFYSFSSSTLPLALSIFFASSLPRGLLLPGLPSVRVCACIQGLHTLSENRAMRESAEGELLRVRKVPTTYSSLFVTLPTLYRTTFPEFLRNHRKLKKKQFHRQTYFWCS